LGSGAVAVRGLGVGQNLLEQVESFACKHHTPWLYLSSTPFLLAAIRLYESFGLRRTADGPHKLFGAPWFTMKKEL